jgi:SAM-dependent methyltransferase
LARYYDAETAHFTDDLPAYLELTERFGGPVLDIGCGTGRVAVYLARHGHRVVGIDISEAMLGRARERAKQEGIPPSLLTWLQADVTSLALEERFGLAVFAYHGFMHLTSQSQQIAALERIRAHLVPGGGLAIALPNPVEMFRAEDVPGLVLERTFTDPQTGQLVMQFSLASVDRASQIMNLTWVYDRIGPDGAVWRDLVPLTMRYTMASEMTLLLERAGLHPVELCGDYDFNPYEETSPHLLVIAERAKQLRDVDPDQTSAS